MLRSNLGLSVFFCLVVSAPAAAQVKLSEAQSAELALLCKTRLQPVAKVDWNDFCSCLAGMTEIKLSRPEYLGLRTAMSGGTAIPMTPPLRAVLNDCVEATTPLKPGTEIIMPRQPSKAPAKTN